MSDKVYIGKKAKDIKASPSFSGYTKVVIIVGDDENGNQIVYKAGTDTGNVLEVTNPWGTQQMANDMLARIQGYAYKPISADGAILTPAAELGDGVTAGSEYSVLASQNVRFDTLHASDIEAPDSGELEHEMPEYLSASDRKIARRFNTITTSFTVKLGEIESEITSDNGAVASRITQRLGDITLSVSSANGSSTFTLKDGTTTLDTETLNLTVSAVNVSGQLTANQIAAGAITASKIDSGAVTADKIAAGAITANKIQVGVIPDRTSDLYNDSDFVDSTDVTTITENTISTTNVYARNLQVDGANVSGTLTAGAIKGGSIGISGASGTSVGSIQVTEAYSTSNGLINLYSDGALRFWANDGDIYIASNTGFITLAPYSAVTIGNDIYPTSNNRYSCGISSFKWTDVYATNATIQTSDKQKKKNIKYGLARFDEFFDKMKPCTYKFKDGHGRTHFGLIAQDIEQLIENCGFDTMDVAAFIKSWNDEQQIYDYALRYTEFVPLLIWEVQQLKARVKELTA